MNSSTYILQAQKKQRPSEGRSVLVLWWIKTYSGNTSKFNVSQQYNKYQVFIYIIMSMKITKINQHTKCLAWSYYDYYSVKSLTLLRNHPQWRSFLPTLRELCTCERLSWKLAGIVSFAKNTCPNSSKAKGKSRLSASVTAPDKNSAETIPKTSTRAEQCTCAGMTPAGLPHLPLSLSDVCGSSATYTQ